ncbi:MAG TPA: hypothetical protein VLX32_10260 [Candidatus Acidoferrum sp.]|nr:hypothetical protein [Candidatus Acidoferrum sp.]
MTIERTVANTSVSMARYSLLLGRSVEVHYRAGDICLPAVGTLVADSGRSIFLEQHYEQRGQEKHFRWEVPYQYIVRIEEKPPVQPVAAVVLRTAEEPTSGSSAEEAADSKPETPQASAARAGGGSGALLPFANRPKTA